MDKRAYVPLIIGGTQTYLFGLVLLLRKSRPHVPRAYARTAGCRLLAISDVVSARQLVPMPNAISSLTQFEL